MLRLLIKTSSLGRPFLDLQGIPDLASLRSAHMLIQLQVCYPLLAGLHLGIDMSRILIFCRSHPDYLKQHCRVNYTVPVHIQVHVAHCVCPIHPPVSTSLIHLSPGPFVIDLLVLPNVVSIEDPLL